jgi:hypothetical protein
MDTGMDKILAISTLNSDVIEYIFTTSFMIYRRLPLQGQWLIQGIVFEVTTSVLVIISNPNSD